MYPYKITLISQEVFNLSLLIQKVNVTSRRIAYFYYYNTELENYKGACLSRYKDNMRLFWPLKMKHLIKLQHTEIYSLFFFFFTFFTFYASRKTLTKFIIYAKKKEPFTSSCQVLLSGHHANYFTVSQFTP